MDLAKSRQSPRARSAVKLIISMGMVLCLVIAVFSLYPALRSYYLAWRVNEQLLQELAVVEDRNDQIREQIAYLNTREGIADRARERFGWVPEGEKAVNITGLEVLDSTTVLPATVAPGSIKAPVSWWSEFCDALFAVEEEADPEPIPDPFINNTE
ncbi:MAG: septum formation initiator family protein [Coriobacteriales bacterium]|jgi:cell division protein FtsB|nr:septum formation initiator family protein [Coriobacteriales bacterium]